MIRKFPSFWEKELKIKNKKNLISECLCKVEPADYNMFTWRLYKEKGVNYINVGFWKSKKDFEREMKNIPNEVSNKTKKFNARAEYNRNHELVIRVIPESGKQRGQIPSNEFEGIWDNAKGYSHETRFVNKGGRLDLYPRKNGGMGRSNNISYITRLIYEIVQDQDMK